MNEIIKIEGSDKIISVDTSKIPDIVSGRIEDISRLEEEVKNSEASAKDAMEYVGNQMTRYEEKGKWIFRHRSGNTKNIIDDTQEAIERLAKANQVSVGALKKSFEFQKKLAETSKYLFELGCANITINRIAVRAIEAKLNGASKGEISELARQEMIAVVRQLKEQEDILKKQEFLTSKVKENVKRLNEKDVIDKEQSEKINSLSEENKSIPFFGAMAGIFAAQNPDLLDGIIFLASYSAEPISDKLKVLSFIGTNDEVLNWDLYYENKENLPAHAEEVVIEGGNHSQFGDYGYQKGDGQAGISLKEQHSIITETILEMVK